MSACHCEIGTWETVPEGVAVKDAHVPEVYQVPPLMTQPFWTPPLEIGRVPFPDGNPPPPPPGDVPFGTYFMPVEGQLDVVPTVWNRLSVVWNLRVICDMLTWICCKKCARLYTSLDIVKVPNLIQCSVFTLDDGVDSSRSPKSSIDCCSGVCGSIGRNNPSSRKELMGAQLAKFSQYR